MRYRQHHTLHWYSRRPQEDDFMYEKKIDYFDLYYR